ncbi:MAG: NAD-dependent epimerase/dehydratase family protein [Spirochaetes bacterium]|nr:NAD-dependent epimerase/dehydratase family protein [Spirochaetota bacterium]
MKAKVLILGASGQLGSRVYKAVQESGKYEIGVLVRNKKKAYISGTHLFYADLLNRSSFPEAIEWADIAVNCSGMVSYHKKEKEQFFDFNKIVIAYTQG